MPKSLLNKNLKLSTKIVDLVRNNTVQPQLLKNEIKKIVGEYSTEKVKTPQTNKLFFEYISNINNLKNLQQTINHFLNSNNFEHNRLKIKKVIQNELETSHDISKIDFNNPFFDEKAIAAYFSLKPIMTVLSKLEGYPFPNYATFKLAALLGNKEDALAYLDNFSKRNKPTPTLQSAIDFDLPEIENKKNIVNEHRAYIKENLVPVRGKFKPKFLKLLKEPNHYNNSFNRFNEFKKNKSNKTKQNSFSKPQKPKSIYTHLIGLLNIIKKEQLNDKILNQKIKNTLKSIPGSILKENHKKRLEEYLNNKEHLKTIISELNVAGLEPKKQLALKKKIVNELNFNKPESSEVYSDSLDKQGVNSYLALKPLARLLDVIEQSDYPLYFAYKLSVLVKSAKEGVALLESFGKHYNGDTPLHDATLFNLPNIDSEFELNKLRDMSSKILRKQYLHEYVDLIGDMHKIFAINNELKSMFSTNNGSKILYHKYINSLKEANHKKLNNTTLTPAEKFLLALDKHVESNLEKRLKKSNVEKSDFSNKEVIKQTLLMKYIVNLNQVDVLQFYAQALSYERAQENVEAATILSKMKVPENYFNDYLNFIKKTQPKTSDPVLPFSYIDGSLHGEEYKNYYIIKLNANDPKAAFLGYPTGCCQSIGSVGEECAKYGVSQENSGFYVLCKGTPPIISKPHLHVDTTQLISAKNIVAQSWVWRSFDSKNNKYSNVAVFDNIEASDNMLESEKRREIVRNMFQLLAKDLCEKSNKNNPIDSVHVGESLGLRHVGYKKAPFSSELFNKEKIMYSGYSDYIDCPGNKVVYDVKEPQQVLFLKGTDKLLEQMKQNKFAPSQINLILKKAKKLLEPKIFDKFFVSTLDLLPGLVKRGKYLSDVLNGLPQKNMNKIYCMFTNKLSDLVKTGEDLGALLLVLDVKNKNDLLDLFHSKLMTLPHTANSILNIIKGLDFDCPQDNGFDQTFHMLPQFNFNDFDVDSDFDESMSDFENNDNTVKKEEHNKLLNISNKIYNDLYKEFPKYIVKIQDLTSLLKRVDISKKDHIMEAFYKKLSSMVTTVGDFVDFYNCFDEQARFKLLLKFKDQLPMMIHSPSEMSRLANALYDVIETNSPLALRLLQPTWKLDHKEANLKNIIVQNCIQKSIKSENDSILLMNGLCDSNVQEKVFNANKDLFRGLSTLGNLIEILSSVHSRFEGQIRPARAYEGDYCDVEDDEYRLREWFLQKNKDKLPLLINSVEDLKKLINLNGTGREDRLVGPQLQILHDALKNKFEEILKNSDESYSMGDIKSLFPRQYYNFSIFFANTMFFNPNEIEDVAEINEDCQTNIFNSTNNMNGFGQNNRFFPVISEIHENQESNEEEEKINEVTFE